MGTHFLRKFKAIARGWWSLISRETPQYSKTRLLICKTCPYSKYWICGKCGCMLAAKARVKDEECPIGRW